MGVQRPIRGGLKRLASNLGKNLAAVVYDGAQAIAVEAQLSIVRGSVSGAGHVASAPGSPPNNDLGTLAGNIEYQMTGPLSAQASSNASTAQHLEYGTSRMAARPYMRPAAEVVRPVIRRNAARAVSAAIRKSGS